MLLLSFSQSTLIDNAIFIKDCTNRYVPTSNEALNVDDGSFNKDGLHLLSGPNSIIFTDFVNGDNSLSSVLDFIWFEGGYPQSIIGEGMAVATTYNFEESEWSGNITNFFQNQSYTFIMNEDALYMYPFTELTGCTDAESTNYNPNATIDNGSCCIELWGECYAIETTTSTDLSNSGLSGEIPPEIGNLVNLEALELHHNQLTGDIPPEIGNLANLEALELHNNQLTGDIPPEIGNLANLEELELHHNQLTGEIPPEIENLVNLEELELHHNQLTGDIPPEIGNLANLEELELHHNQLTGEIPPEIGNLEKLDRLWLFYNQLSGEIPPEIGNLVNLEELELRNNHLSGEIPPEIGNLEKLDRLWLFYNQLSGEIPPEIGNLENLTSLWLFSNQLSGEIPSEIGNLVNLELLSLYSNQLSGGIPSEIENLVNLNELHLSNNLIATLPLSMGNLDFLSYLDVSNNQLYCEDGEQNENLIPDFLTNGSIEVIGLDLQNCCADGLEEDCTGLCGGVAVIDQCGVCDGYGAIYECGCSEIESGACDCAGNVLDECGVCGGDNLSCADCAGMPNGSNVEDMCGTCDSDSSNDCIHLSIILDGLDLVSFYALPENNSIENILGGIVETNPGVLGEGNSAHYLNGQWIGTLTTIDFKNGYWIKVSSEAELNVEGLPVDPLTNYSLHSGSNLISYPFAGFIPLIETIPEETQNSIIGILSEGEATMNTESGWVGSLIDLSGSKGYWFKTHETVDFTYEFPASNDSLARHSKINKILPEAFTFNQSTQQAFYFVNFIEIDDKPLETGDLFIIYNKDIVVGSRYWHGEIIDVPAMGSDGSDNTVGYMEVGSTPQFKLLRDGELINLVGEIPAWSNNQLYVISSLREAHALPKVFSLDRAYPNPFNPTTTLNFSLPIETEVSISVYNLQGRQVSSLVNGYVDAGYHSVIWDANRQASGEYLVKMVVGGSMKTQKLMLVK